ncbi:hypothetical protein GGI11_005818 [Coemansia sp. RSA 2049]|nr:hypothetical protein GGI11_005818 [Coemansia sp. RSA 2049]
MSLSKLLLEKYGPEPLSRSFRAPFKSIVEKRIINASAEIRKDPDWAKHLGSKEKRQSWAEASAEKFNTTPGDMDYIFNELEYYKVLQENTPQNMVLGGADMVWCKDITADDSLTLEIKQYAVVLEAVYPKKHVVREGNPIEAVIPLAEQVLTDLIHPTGLRVIVDNNLCVKFTAPHPVDDTWGVSDLGDDDAWDAWEEGIVYTEPVPKGFTKSDRPLPLPPTYSLRGEELQVVVEMDTTYLTPESPKKGPERIPPDWQNSGVLTDKIVATAIWYYDVENAEISDIQFRDPVGTHEEHDIMISDILEKKIFEYAYGVDEDYDVLYCYSQPVATTGIKSGRIVCFPNSYQHLEQSVELADPSRCGHVRKLYFHFVHPGVRIPSTSIVAPQWQEWWAESAFSVPPLDRLPAELQVMIQQRVDMPMSLEEAYRKYVDRSDYRHRVNGESEIYDAFVHYGDMD